MTSLLMFNAGDFMSLDVARERRKILTARLSSLQASFEMPCPDFLISRSVLAA